MDTLAERFALIRKHFGNISQREMADRLQIAKNTWQRYENGDLPSTTLLLSLAKEGINSHWLLTGEGRMLSKASPRSEHAQIDAEMGTNLTQTDYVKVPRFAVQAAAGAGALNADQAPVGSVAFSREWLHRVLRANPSDLLVIEAKGDSMAGVIDDGDIMLIDTSEPKVRGNGIYIFLVDGLLLVKYLRIRVDGSLELTGAGEEASHAEVISRSDLDRVSIIGRTIWKAGRA